MLVVEFGEISTLLFALRSCAKIINETVSSVSFGQKIPGLRLFEVGRKSTYLLFPKRGEEERKRERGGGGKREKGRNTHVNALGQR